jgi:hypothetical protein
VEGQQGVVRKSCRLQNLYIDDKDEIFNLLAIFLHMGRRQMAL